MGAARTAPHPVLAAGLNSKGRAPAAAALRLASLVRLLLIAILAGRIPALERAGRQVGGGGPREALGGDRPRRAPVASPLVPRNRRAAQASVLRAGGWEVSV